MDRRAANRLMLWVISTVSCLPLVFNSIWFIVPRQDRTDIFKILAPIVNLPGMLAYGIAAELGADGVTHLGSPWSILLFVVIDSALWALILLGIWRLVDKLTYERGKDQ